MLQEQIRLDHLQLHQLRRMIQAPDQVHPGIGQRLTGRLQHHLGRPQRLAFRRDFADPAAELRLNAEVARDSDLGHRVAEMAVEEEQRQFALLAHRRQERLDQRRPRRAAFQRAVPLDPDRLVRTRRDLRLDHQFVATKRVEGGLQGFDGQSVVRVGRHDRRTLPGQLDEVGLVRVPAQHRRRINHLQAARLPRIQLGEPLRLAAMIAPGQRRHDQSRLSPLDRVRPGLRRDRQASGPERPGQALEQRRPGVCEQRLVASRDQEQDVDHRFTHAC